MSNCPKCGTEASEDDQVYSRLSDLGYLHTDTKFTCPECDHTWIHGEPQGEPMTDKWVCDSCGGDLIPHFLFVNPSEQTFETRPKCQDCYLVPAEKVSLDGQFNGENIRGFVGHHTTTGDRDEASEKPI
jgi:predicted RNA-binding Zn-ribbon protein involved in translation (DUF1610 family)